MPAHAVKVLFLPKWYPDKNDPQNGIFIRKHAEAVAQFCDVKVLRISRDAEMSSKFRIEEGTTQLQEVFSYYRPSKGGAGKIINFWRYNRAFNKGWKILKNSGWEPDLVHVHVMVRPGLMAYLKGWPMSKPYLISEHSSEYINSKWSQKGGFFKALNFRIFWKAKAVTAVSPQLVDAMQELGLPGNFKVVPNVVDLPEIKPRAQHGRIRILTIADLVDDIKNISGILDVVSELVNEGADIEYHLVGGGPDESMLQERAKSIPADRVTLYGRLDNVAAMEKLADMDMVVINSRVETFGLVVAEAISMGKPVVVSKCGGPETFVNEDTGVLVEVDDQISLKAGIQEVISKLENYDAGKMRATLGDRYSRETVGKQFYDIYKEILNNN